MTDGTNDEMLHELLIPQKTVKQPKAWKHKKKNRSSELIDVQI